MIEELKPFTEDIIRNLLPNGKVKNKPNGNKEYWINCPFHTDNNPSFSLNLTTGLANCFGCGYSGDIINVYANINNLSDGEAIIELKEKYLNDKSISKSETSKNSSSQPIKKANYIWENSKEKQEILIRYLKGRGINFNSDSIS